MNKLHPLKVIGIMLILFGLPAGSWFFMKSGADLRKAAMNELEVFGQLSDFELMTLDGDGINLEDVNGKVLIASFLPNDELKREENLKQLKWIQDQFMDRLLNRNDFMVLTHVVADSLVQLKELEKAIRSQKYRRWSLVGGSETVLSELGKNAYSLPLKSGESVFDNPYLAIVDVKSEVRYFYNIFEKEDIAKLLVHMSLLLPQLDDRKVDIKTVGDN